MKLAFTELGWSDYLWFQSHQAKLLKRINTLIREIQRHPLTGTGKPEPLKGELAGYWSRRINAEHRLVYRIEAETALIISCRFHYHK